jgi:prophage regulatory protein
MEKLPIRVLDRKELRDMVPYSYQHILRLEKAGRFPRRVRLGAARVGWILDEVVAWIEARVAERESPKS